MKPREDRVRRISGSLLVLQLPVGDCMEIRGEVECPGRARKLPPLPTGLARCPSSSVSFTVNR